jgi:hypothetical protein
MKDDVFEIEGNEAGEFYVSMVLRHRISNFRWELIMVYEPAQHDRSQDFITELSRKCLYSNLPVVIGGDFNMIR